MAMFGSSWLDDSDDRDYGPFRHWLDEWGEEEEKRKRDKENDDDDGFGGHKYFRDL